MEKAMEFFDAWIKSQKEFLDNWVKSQRDFMNNWTESTKKLQESFMSLGWTQQGPGKEMLSVYTSWVNTMVNSSKVFTDEAVKIQENWRTTMERQMEMSREMTKNFLDLLKAGGKKQ